MSDTRKEIVTHNLLEEIAPENLTKGVVLILSYIGSTVIATTQIEAGETDYETGIEEELRYTSYEFPRKKENLAILGDDAWGIVVGAFVLEGHLILTANYGDEGEVDFSITYKDCNYLDMFNIAVLKSLGDIHSF